MSHLDRLQDYADAELAALKVDREIVDESLGEGVKAALREGRTIRKGTDAEKYIARVVAAFAEGVRKGLLG